jgi:hypothetical protein
MAIVSPVVRISRPFFVGLQEGREGALGGFAGDRIEFDRADQAEVSDVDDVRQVLQRMQARFPIGGDVAGAVEQAFFLVGFERREAAAEAIGLPE